MRVTELTLPPASGGIEWPSWASDEELALVMRMQDLWVDQLSYHLSYAQIQGFELALNNIYTICELLECVKGPVLLMQICRISMIQTNRLSKKSPEA